MTKLISTRRQFETLLQNGADFEKWQILFLLAGVGGLYANNLSKVQIRYRTGLKLLRDQSQNVVVKHAKANIWFTMAAFKAH